MNRRLIRKDEFVETLLPKFQFKPGEYYIQCAATNHFLALQVRHLLLDNTQERIPTFTGLIKLVQHQDGSTVLYSSLNDMRLKVDNSGEIVTVSQYDNELEDFELFQAVGNKNGQLIIRSIQTKMFVRVSESSLRLCADVVHPFYASKFVLKSRYLSIATITPHCIPYFTGEKWCALHHYHVVNVIDECNEMRGEAGGCEPPPLSEPVKFLTQDKIGIF